ncbi:MAG: HAD family hydrolase [Salinisphaera sp.]|jgi:2-haloacid dehalogenase|nr:HAD family hydrolase [Salinisphaera sp.]
MTQNDSAPILVFDVNETLLDITALEPLFVRIFGNRSALREWFAQLILYSQTMTLSGLYTPFGELGVGTLRMVASIHGATVADQDIEELQERMGSMPAHPDAAPALTRLRNADFRLVTLTNSASSSSPTPLERAGLGDFFEQFFSVQAIQKFKPAPETYQHVADTMGVTTSSSHRQPLVRPGLGPSRRSLAPGSNPWWSSPLTRRQPADLRRHPASARRIDVVGIPPVSGAFQRLTSAFFAAWPMLAACVALYLLRDHDNLFTLSRTSAR